MMKSKVNDLSNPFQISIISEGLLPLCGIKTKQKIMEFCVDQSFSWDCAQDSKWNFAAFHSVQLGVCCLLSCIPHHAVYSVSFNIFSILCDGEVLLLYQQALNQGM